MKSDFFSNLEALSSAADKLPSHAPASGALGALMDEAEVICIQAAVQRLGIKTRPWCVEQLQYFDALEPLTQDTKTHVERVRRFQEYIPAPGRHSGSAKQYFGVQITNNPRLHDMLYMFAQTATNLIGNGVNISKSMVLRYLWANGARLVLGLPNEFLCTVSETYKKARLVKLKRELTGYAHVLRTASVRAYPDIQKIRKYELLAAEVRAEAAAIQAASDPNEPMFKRLRNVDTFHPDFDVHVPVAYNLPQLLSQRVSKYEFEKKMSTIPGSDYAAPSFAAQFMALVEAAVPRHRSYGYDLNESYLRAKLEAASGLKLTDKDATPSKRIQDMYLDPSRQRPWSREEQLQRLQLEREGKLQLGQEAKALPPSLSQTEQAATTLPATPVTPAISQPDAFPEIRLDEEESWSSED